MGSPVLDLSFLVGVAMALWVPADSVDMASRYCDSECPVSSHVASRWSCGDWGSSENLVDLSAVWSNGSVCVACCDSYKTCVPACPCEAFVVTFVLSLGDGLLDSGGDVLWWWPVVRPEFDYSTAVWMVLPPVCWPVDTDRMTSIFDEWVDPWDGASI